MSALTSALGSGEALKNNINAALKSQGLKESTGVTEPISLDSSKDTSSMGLSSGAIAGIVIGTVAGVVILSGGAYAISRSKNQSKATLAVKESVKDNTVEEAVVAHTLFASTPPPPLSDLALSLSNVNHVVELTDQN